MAPKTRSIAKRGRPPPPPEVLGREVRSAAGKAIPWPKKPPPMTDTEIKKRRAKIDKLLTKIYYDVDTGFGHIEDVLRQAQQTDKGYYARQR